MDVAVVGGGIGGLSAALALAGDGHSVTVLERAEYFEAVGAGIVLAPNAVQVLAALGVDLGGAGRVLARTEVQAATGDPLSVIDLREVERRHGPTYAIARPVLHARLTAALPPSVEVVLGTPVTSVRETGDGVDLELPGTPRRFDVVVAADGLRSAVRSRIGGPTDLRYSGTTCWRGILPLPAGDVAVEAWGAGTRVGVVPVDDESAYYYLVRSAPPGEPGPASADLLQAAFAGYRGIAGEVVQALTQLPPLHHDLFELDRPFWGSARVLLLGDAAHAMTPNQGQGAAMAIEDAAALVAALRGGVAGAAQRYVDLRGRRVRRVQLNSRRIGAISHLGGPRAHRLRDTVMRLAPAGSGTRAVQQLIAPGIALAALPAPSAPPPPPGTH